MTVFVRVTGQELLEALAASAAAAHELPLPYEHLRGPTYTLTGEAQPPLVEDTPIPVEFTYVIQ